MSGRQTCPTSRSLRNGHRVNGGHEGTQVESYGEHQALRSTPNPGLHPEADCCSHHQRPKIFLYGSRPCTFSQSPDPLYGD